MGGGSSELKTLKVGIDSLYGMVQDLRYELRGVGQTLERHQKALELLQGQLAKPAVGAKAKPKRGAKRGRGKA